MASQEYNSSDLTSILKTLSALSNPASQNQVESIQNAHYQKDKPEEDSYEPSDAIPPNTIPPVAQRNPTTSAIPQTNSQSNTPAKQPTGNTITIDPSTITAWPTALRYVMRTVSQSEEIQRRIRRLIQSQHDHEKQWWQGREALLKKQSARVEKKKELDEVLRSVGAPVDEKEVSTAEENQAEITNYDCKVYKASRQMADAMMMELRALKIPFFAIKSTFIETTSTNSVESNRSISDPHSQQTLSKDELTALQRRMLELLQDLCRE